MNAASHSKNLIDIIDSGCELEDISSIIPENLSGNIDKLINQTLDFIRGAPDFGGAVDKEIILVKKNISLIYVGDVLLRAFLLLVV